MMDQPTFADLEYQGKKRKTRRELFLEREARRVWLPDMGVIAYGRKISWRVRPTDTRVWTPLSTKDARLLTY